MKYRALGKTGIKVSSYCLGTMMFGKGGNPDHNALLDRIDEIVPPCVDVAPLEGAGYSPPAIVQVELRRLRATERAAA